MDKAVELWENFGVLGVYQTEKKVTFCSFLVWGKSLWLAHL